MTQTTDVPLSASQIRFLMDLMMGCPLGHTALYAGSNKINASDLYNQLQNCLPTAPQDPE